MSLVTVFATRRALLRTELSDGFTLIESPNLLDLVYGVGLGYGLLGLPWTSRRVNSGTSLCAIVEAMACGIPVVVASVGGISELVDDGRTGSSARQASRMRSRTLLSGS